MKVIKGIGVTFSVLAILYVGILGYVEWFSRKFDKDLERELKKIGQ